jgi:hypothetical protein
LPSRNRSNLLSRNANYLRLEQMTREAAVQAPSANRLRHLPALKYWLSDFSAESAWCHVPVGAQQWSGQGKRIQRQLLILA